MRVSFSDSNHTKSQSPDILDFLDNVKRDKALTTMSDSDIVDIVQAFYDSKSDQNIFRVTKNVKSSHSCESLIPLTLSTIAIMPEDLDRYQYLYEERAAIREFDSLSPVQINRELAESEALEEVKKLYAAEKKIIIDSPEVINFFNHLTIH